MYVEKAIELVVEQFVERRIYGASLINSALLAHYTMGDVVSGYKVIDKNKTFISYFWVYLEGRCIDIADIIYKRLKLSKPLFIHSHLTEMDPGIDYFYVSTLKQVELRELENAYNFI